MSGIWDVYKLGFRHELLCRFDEHRRRSGILLAGDKQRWEIYFAEGLFSEITHASSRHKVLRPRGVDAQDAAEQVVLRRVSCRESRSIVNREWVLRVVGRQLPDIL